MWISSYIIIGEAVIRSVSANWKRKRTYAHLVNGRDDLRLREDDIEILLRAVGDADRLGFTLLENIFHLLPRIRQLPVVCDVAAAIEERGDDGVVAVGVHGDWPVDEVHYITESQRVKKEEGGGRRRTVNVVSPETLKGLIKACFDAVMPRSPDFAGDVYL